MALGSGDFNQFIMIAYVYLGYSPSHIYGIYYDFKPSRAFKMATGGLLSALSFSRKEGGKGQ